MDLIIYTFIIKYDIHFNTNESDYIFILIERRFMSSYIIFKFVTVRLYNTCMYVRLLHNYGLDFRILGKHKISIKPFFDHFFDKDFG